VKGSTIPWSYIVGVRDLLADDYFRVDLTIVERTVRRIFLSWIARSLARPRRVERG
jgi:uncharacterized protein with HEPN domain